jgi:hypothetical protein
MISDFIIYGGVFLLFFWWRPRKKGMEKEIIKVVGIENTYGGLGQKSPEFRE